MKYVITLLSLLISTFCIAQKKGLNFDPGSEAIGDRPYEMETRHEKKIHLFLLITVRNG
jgi:hypothetical protein